VRARAGAAEQHVWLLDRSPLRHAGQGRVHDGVQAARTRDCGRPGAHHRRGQEAARRRRGGGPVDSRNAPSVCIIPLLNAVQKSTRYSRARTGAGVGEKDTSYADKVHIIVHARIRCRAHSHRHRATVRLIESDAVMHESEKLARLQEHACT